MKPCYLLVTYSEFIDVVGSEHRPPCRLWLSASKTHWHDVVVFIAYHRISLPAQYNA